MASLADLPALVAGLPGAQVAEDGFSAYVVIGGKPKGFCWVWNEKVDPKKRKVPNPDVLAVLTPNLAAKQMLLDAEPDTFFTEPHYNGFPAVLVRLAAIPAGELGELLVEAWRCKASKTMLKEYGD